MFFLLPALTSFLLGLLFVLSLIIDASYEQIYAEVCLKRSLCTEHGTVNEPRFLCVQCDSNSPTFAVLCVWDSVEELALNTFFYALVLCSEDGDGFSCSVCGSSVYAAFRLSRWSRLHPESFFQQPFQRICISGWKAAVVTPSYPVSQNKFCIHHISWEECDLLLIISSALQPPSHSRTMFFPPAGMDFCMEARKSASNSNYSAALLVHLGDFSLRNSHPRTHTEGRICDSAGGLCITAAISWVQEERAYWQPLICAAIN